ncbi:MAG: DUF6851 domain-containing protein [Planctomycetota bacterium]|jgi:hypothetical protein
MSLRTRLGQLTLLASIVVAPAAQAGTPDHSVARQWNEALLDAIRLDYARPTVHARNLFHTSVVMWDAWTAYDDRADGWLVQERQESADVLAARNEAISFAAYRLLHHRFLNSPSADVTLPALDQLMDDLGYDRMYTGTVGDDPASLGNRIAAAMIDFGLVDGANEAGEYENLWYEPVNEPLLPDFPGNPEITDPNRWQPLALEWFIGQGGIFVGEYPDFLSPEWGQVDAFALTPADLTTYHRDGFDYLVYHDPGPPPYIGGKGDAYYKWGFEMVSTWAAHLDPADNEMIDISPGSIGNAALPTDLQIDQFYDFFEGGDWGTGYAVNPATGQPYDPQIVPRGDYARILAEFWADGPHSETPPGHWFVILNYVNDHPQFEKRLGGGGPLLDALEWDVKSYLAMGAAMHDVAVSAWGVKGWYDYIRPISAIRYMCDLGQCSNPGGPSYHVDGINLHEGLIEVVTAESVMPGERHEHLSDGGANIGKIAVYSWRGPEYINDPETDIAGVGWILAENWWPYQRPTFVTPPFAGYVSGHSTYSRAAALLMELLTGDEYFPGGLGEFYCPENQFLVFEDGPSMDVTLQWARYMDASDQCSLSRIWGGIHPPADDIPGRRMGNAMGPAAWELARLYYAGHAVCPGDLDDSGGVTFRDLLVLIGQWGPCVEGCYADLNLDGTVNVIDLVTQLGNMGPCSP